MTRARAATRRDVAERAGVAPSTVSLVLNRTAGPSIPPATRARVEAAARELGYRSHATARALATGRTMAIGVVLHYVRQPFQSYAAGVLDGAWDELATAGYRLLITPGSPDACVAGLFRERTVDGLLVLAPQVSADDAELRDCLAARFPTVFVGARPEAGEVDDADVDNLAAGRAIGERLLRAGHRRIAHLCGPLAHSSAARERLAGVRAALADAGVPLPDERVLDGSWSLISSEQCLGDALDAGLDVTAIACANEAMARGAIAALERRGRVVPHDMSIATILSAPEPTGTTLPLTGVVQPLHDVGLAAARLLRERLAKPGRPRRALLPCVDVAGATVAPR